MNSQVLMFNSLNDFKKEAKNMWHRQSTTVRNVAGFRNTGQNTLFSNSFIRDSVISTLKQSGPEGERFSEYSSDANAEHNLTNPRLSTDRYRDSIR